MGVVYEAWDLQLERRVAVKLLHPEITAGAGNAARLEREARNAARVEHPHVVRLYRIETLDGQLAIEMQYIDGTALVPLISEGAVAPSIAVVLLRQVLEALAACHAQGIIHCDLKPGNLLITPEGFLYLTDFGISRAVQTVDGGETLEPPQTGPLWGTPRYTPPEAWRGTKPDARWDLYSAGAVIHEALSGGPLFEAPTPEAIMRLKLGEDLPPVRSLVPGLSPELAGLLDALTARDPEQRPASARDALALLQAAPEYQASKDASDTFGALFRRVHRAEQTTSMVLDRTPVRRRISPRYLSVATAMLILAAVLYVSRGRVAAPPDTGSDSAPAIAAQKLDSDLVMAEYGVCFAYDDGIHGKELWHLSNISRALTLVKDIAPGPASSNPHAFFRRGNSNFLFAASTPEYGEELWFADVENVERPDALRMVKDILPGPMGSDPVPVMKAQSLVFFEARTLVHGHELWCTNTHPSQTAIVADLVAGPEASIPMDSRVYPEQRGAYMIGYGGEPPLMRLWRYDLDSNVVLEIAQVHPDSMNMGIAGGKLIINNHDEAHGMELWVHDPSLPGIQLLADLRPGPEPSGPGYFKTWRGQVFFQAGTPESGVELWCTDGTSEGTRMIKDLNPGMGDSSPYGYVETANVLYFRARDEIHGQELWMTDGTEEGTQLVADVWPGPESGTPYNMVAQGAHFYFSANDGEHGEELWMLDLEDPTRTCRLAADLRAGPEGSEPHNLTWWGDGSGVFVAWTAPTTLQLVTIRQLATRDVEVEPVVLP